MTEITQTSDNGLQFLAKEEGLIKRPYLDSVGIPTIGIGMTYYPSNGKKVTMQDPPITEAQAIDMFRSMLKNYELAVYSMTRDDINHHQFDALVSLTYNIGTNGFKGSQLRTKVNGNLQDPTIQQAFEQWKNAGGKPILLSRRKREALMYFTPDTQAFKTPEQIYKDHVKFIQTKLGLTLIDGIIGKGTIAAIKAFQKRKGLVADGIVGAQTLVELNKI